MPTDGSLHHMSSGSQTIAKRQVDNAIPSQYTEVLCDIIVKTLAAFGRGEVRCWYNLVLSDGLNSQIQEMPSYPHLQSMANSFFLEINISEEVKATSFQRSTQLTPIAR